jgi:trehalose-phosphatase
VESLARLLGLSNVPELIGCHGAEILTRGAHKPVIEVSTIASSNLEKIKKLVSGSALKDFSEIKPSGIAFHWRGEQKSIKEMINAKVLEFWTNLPPTSVLEIHPFDGGIEIRCTGINKGLAVTRILRESKPNSIVAFLGDDQTDEEAFAAIGDRGLKVLVRNNLRPTRANVKLTPPHELVDFLDNWIDADMY